MKRFVPVLCLLLASATAFAQTQPVPAPPVIGATSYLMIDAKSGHDLASLKPDTPVPPASLTKLMTTYVVLHAIADGQITLEDEVTVSEKAWRMQGSRMFIEVGSRVRVRDLLLGVIVQSGNDASVALAEYVAGSEEVFAQMMNQYAQALGMKGSTFPAKKALQQARALGSPKVHRAIGLLAAADVDVRGATATADRTTMEVLVARLATLHR
jgi:D-alanyl-D-alanine carboxypeptidase (penicillin-binding protein 5/6)